MKSVIAAMDAQPRLIESLAGSSTVGRVIVDAKARYLVLYSPSGKLTMMDTKGGWSTGGWRGAATAGLGSRYTTTTSGATVIYRSSVGHVTVDARTRLIRSSFSAALPQGGVPAYTATYSYPASVTELGAPTPRCH